MSDSENNGKPDPVDAAIAGVESQIPATWTAQIELVKAEDGSERVATLVTPRKLTTSDLYRIVKSATTLYEMAVSEEMQLAMQTPSGIILPEKPKILRIDH